MQNITMALAYITFVFSILVPPIFGYIRKKRLEDKQEGDSPNHFKSYRRSIISNLIPVILAGFVIVSLNKPLLAITPKMSLSTRVVGGLFAFTWALSLIPRKSKDVTLFQGIKNIISGLPNDNKEKILLIVTCIVGGVSNELLYRAYLIFFTMNIFPVVSLFTAIVISTVIFALGRIYYGWRAFLWDSYVGLVMCFLYIASGSIIPSMVTYS